MTVYMTITFVFRDSIFVTKLVLLTNSSAAVYRRVKAHGKVSIVLNLYHTFLAAYHR